MSIVEGLLFYATLSEKCQSILHQWDDIKNRLPEISLSKIPLDNAQSRKRVSAGTKFNITSVPTLLLITDTGTIQIIENTRDDTILNVFRTMYDAKVKHIQDSETLLEDSNVNGLDHSSFDGMIKSGTGLDESNSVDIPPPLNVKKSKLNFQPVSGTKSISETRKTKEINVESKSENHTKPHPGLKAKKKSGSTDIAALAAQMQRDREAALGYKPDDVDY